MLERLTMTGLKTLNTRNGVAWTATLRLEGLPFAHVEDAGRGGCLRYTPKAKVEDFRSTLTQLKDAAKEATGLAYEALDMVVACMDNKTPGSAAVKIAIAAVA